MSRSLRILLVVGVSAVIDGRLLAQSLPGSQTPLEENACAMCHGASELWQGDQRRLYISTEELADDVHWKKGVVCHDCHGGDPTGAQFRNTHRGEKDFRGTADEVEESCARCHKVQMIDAKRKSVHAKGGERNELGERTPINCRDCHGMVKHQLLAAQDPRSPVFVDNQVQTCGACHEKELETYKNSVHGRMRDPLAPVATAFCADCHGTHGIYRNPDRRSTLHASQVATTCGKCHQGVETQLQNSVHARDGDLEELRRGEHRPRKRWQKPTCISCHQRHEPALPESPEFFLQQQLPSGCGNCHTEFSGQHAQRLHSQLTEFGYVPAAKCSECHGTHDVLALSNPDGRLANANRLHTCQECHPRAVHNFADFDPHANYKDAQNYPGLHDAHAWVEALIFAALIFFGVHSFLWLLRSLVHVVRFGRHKRLASDQRAIIRFTLVYRAFHSLIVISLMGLALTGLLLRYSEQAWTQRVAHAVGGFPVASLWHKAFAVLTICYCVAYGVWIAIRMSRLRRRQVPWNAILFGPNSPAFNSRDRKDCFGMVRWFFGLGTKPTFERWTYWEKFDYWAVVSIMAFIGTTGLVIWLPNLFARFLPGGALNLAEMIHSEVSLLVTSFLMAIHYFNTHFRPEKFPMDLSVLTGIVSEEHLQRARPEYLERMRREGRLDERRTTLPSRKKLWAIIIGGYLVHAIGLALLSVILWASLGG